MTFEHKCSIAPADIKAVQMECKKCGYRAIRSVAGWLQESAQCPNCGQIWSIGGGEYKQIKMLVAAVRALAELDQLPFSIRFEIDCPENAK